LFIRYPTAETGLPSTLTAICFVIFGNCSVGGAGAETGFALSPNALAIPLAMAPARVGAIISDSLVR